LISYVVVLLLAQSPDAVGAAADRAAAAAERTAIAAERTAAATEKIAQAQAGAAPTPAPAPAEEKKDDETLKGLIGIGLIHMAGNSESLTATLGIQLDKKWGGWGLGLRANGAYGQSAPNPDVPSQVVAMRASAIVRGDRQLIELASLYLLGGVETDHVKSVEIRGLAELGVGLKFLDRKDSSGEYEKVYLRADVGFRFSHETRFQYFASSAIPAGTGLAGVTLVAPRFGAVFRYALNKHIRFSEELEVLPNVLGASRVLLNNNTKLSARLTEMLSINAAFLLAYDTAPAGGKRPIDTLLVLGLEAAF
jgi:opacity protein-like surface antigen